MNVLMALVIRFFNGCQSFLDQVESVISDPIHLFASMAAIRCFPPTGNLGVKILLGELAVGGVTQTKTKTDIPT